MPRVKCNVGSATRLDTVNAYGYACPDENVPYWVSSVMAASARRPTMNDVARVAGVSLATVSRVVNGDGKVRPELASRVRDAVGMLGYRRDVTASTLRRADRLSASIGLIIEDVSNPFFSAVNRGVEDVARTHGVLTFVGSSDEEPGRERDLAEAFAGRGVDGLVIVPCGSDQSYLVPDRQRGTGLVFVDRPARFIDADAVVSDNAGGARAAVEHLLRAGHRSIAFLGDRPSIFTAVERRRGYYETLADAGLGTSDGVERVGLMNAESAELAIRDLMLADNPPTALFTAQNLVTIGAIRALRAAGRQHDVALVGFDDVVLGDVVEPGVTVVAQDPYALGRHAAELLFSQMADGDGESRLIVVPTELVVRGSGEIPPA
jgi:LacI family transcriptional regulator, galactose operon repressor